MQVYNENEMRMAGSSLETKLSFFLSSTVVHLLLSIKSQWHVSDC